MDAAPAGLHPVRTGVHGDGAAAVAVPGVPGGADAGARGAGGGPAVGEAGGGAGPGVGAHACDEWQVAMVRRLASGVWLSVEEIEAVLRRVRE